MSDASVKKNKRLYRYGLFFAALFLLAAEAAFFFSPYRAESCVLVNMNGGAELMTEDIRALEASPVFSAVYPYARESASFASTGSHSTEGTLYRVTADYLTDVLGMLRCGHIPFDNEQGQNWAVLSEPVAEALFARADAVGETVVIDGTKYTVSGVRARAANVPEKLSEYGENAVYVLQTSEKLQITDMEAMLRPGVSETLALRWLNGYWSFGDKRAVSLNLSADWAGLKSLAGALIGLSLFVYFIMAKRALSPRMKRERELIRQIRAESYSAAAAKKSIRPMAGLVFKCILLCLILAGAGFFALSGLYLPPQFIPKRFLLPQIRDAFLTYVKSVNTRAAVAHPLIAAVHWYRAAVIAIGVPALIMAILLCKNREVKK